MLEVKKNQLSGFTLIELLVVIGIIGVLATLTAAILSSVKAKVRDAKRMNDTRQIFTALDIYYQDHGYYPYADRIDEGARVEFSDSAGDGADNKFIGSLQLEGYFKETPVDPINRRPFFFYLYYTYDCDGTIRDSLSLTPTHYLFCWFFEENNNNYVRYVINYCSNPIAYNQGSNSRRCYHK